MSRLIYIIPWAICDTENLYVKKMDLGQTVAPVEIPKEGDSVDDWTVKSVIPSPDRRSKDVYVELDVYRGYDFKSRSKDVSVLTISNSVSHLRELGYTAAEEDERSYLRRKVLKLDKG